MRGFAQNARFVMAEINPAIHGFVKRMSLSSDCPGVAKALKLLGTFCSLSVREFRKCGPCESPALVLAAPEKLINFSIYESVL